MTRDGRIVARRIRAAHASGAYGALKSNTSLATWHYAGGQYRIEHADIEFLQIYTNTVPGGYYRSPGAVATAFAVDCHTDILAHELAMDPAEFRLKNFLDEGEADAVGHELRNVRFREVLQGALDAAGWKKPKKRNHGRGIALSGRHISGGDTGVVLSVDAGGGFSILSPSIDQGSGTHTILRQLVADQMKVPIDHVRVIVGDTDSAPRDSGMRASRMTYVAGNAIMQACEKLRKRLLDQAARLLECTVDDVEFDNGRFSLRQDSGQQVSLRRVVAQATERLEVTSTKIIRIRKISLTLCPVARSRRSRTVPAVPGSRGQKSAGITGPTGQRRPNWHWPLMKPMMAVKQVAPIRQTRKPRNRGPSPGTKRARTQRDKETAQRESA